MYFSDCLSLDIKHDNHPEDITWALKIYPDEYAPAEDAVTVRFGNLTYEHNGFPCHKVEDYLQCYKFEMYDSYGDGICCGKGNGYAMVK